MPTRTQDRFRQSRLTGISRSPRGGTAVFTFDVAGYPGTAETILKEIQQVGLNPADVKYILLGHGHGDHYAAAFYFQEHYGTRVGAGVSDWDLMHPPGAPANSANPDEAPRPRRDLVLKEGTPVTLGDHTISVIEIPGHTPGSLAFIFNVRNVAWPIGPACSAARFKISHESRLAD